MTSRRFSPACVGAWCSSLVLLVACSGDFGPAPPAEDSATPLAEGVSGPTASEVKREAERVRAFLDARYTKKDVRHSFHTKFGETIDCIDFFAQEGVKELAAQGTPIAELPAPTAAMAVPPAFQDVLFTGAADDEGQPRACPQNSVPILRITPDRIHGAGGLDTFVKAHQRKLSNRHAGGGGGVAPPSVDLSRYAHAEQDYSGSTPLIVGVATVNVQNPVVILPKDHSIMQTWLMDNRSGQLQTVETGTNVDPLLYGDRNTHFFIFATNNNYDNGCYNNMGGHPGSCLSWVGAPGAYLTPGMTLSSSEFYGMQAELTLTTANGSPSSGWNILGAGVYPATDFSGAMQTTATMFDVGGEVYDDTQSWYVPMGSGAEPMAAYGQAAYWNAPGYDGLSVRLSTGSWDTTSFGNPYSDVPSAYGTHWWGNRVYVGPLQKSFYSGNYGYQWSSIGDWAYGSYKAQCDYQVGVPLKGVATSLDGTSTQSILCGDYIQMGTGGSCYPRSFANGDNRGSPGADWDPGYVKAECGYAEVATGIAQSASHQLNTLLCCAEQGNADHVSCTVEKFESSDSPSYGSGPDWAIGEYKGVCPVGKAVVGISRKSTGAAHAILCCYME
jgi:neprosin-like protein